jgi:hypothetical protein
VTFLAFRHLAQPLRYMSFVYAILHLPRNAESLRVDDAETFHTAKHKPSNNGTALLDVQLHIREPFLQSCFVLLLPF